MIVSAHQPHYLPWCGYINKILLSDIFVVMDDMSFTSYNYINRNRIIQTNTILKISIPLKNKKTIGRKIKDVELDYSHSFRGVSKHIKSIEYNYKKCIGFDYFFPLLYNVLNKNYKWLLDLDLEIIYLIINYLDIKTKVVLSSESNIGGKKEDELFISLLEKTNSTQVLLGLGASNDYINKKKIYAKGGEIVYQKFTHPNYDQNTSNFIKGISIIDMLLNLNKKDAKRLIKNIGKIIKNKSL